MSNSINLTARTKLFNFGEVARSRLQKAAKATLIEMGERLINRSPVGDPSLWKQKYWPKGYLPGHFINNWQVGIDSIPTGIISAIDPSGNGSRERLSHLGRWQLNHTYYFVNNLPYAKRLEHGWSSQAPAGMVGLTRLEFPEIIRNVRAKLKAGEI